MRSVLVVSLAVFGGCHIPVPGGGGSSGLETNSAVQTSRMCSDANYAYEQGYNAGLRRASLSTEWAYTCQPAWQQYVRTAYQNGFNTGIAYAPTYVAQPYAVAATGYRSNVIVVAHTAGQACTFSSDCGSGHSCRRDNSGTNVCMGGGYSGDPCWFMSDCASNSCDDHSCR